MIGRHGCGVAALVAAASLLAGSGARAQAAAGRSAADSVGRVVQEFYRWYVPRARSGGPGAPWMAALRRRPASFAPALVEALTRDSVASARSRDEVVGLDGDPFLDSQDPCERYVVRRVVPQGARFLVDVVGEGGCGTHAGPDVVAEVARREAGWRFENFRYPAPAEDLLALLRRLHGPPRGARRASPHGS